MKKTSNKPIPNTQDPKTILVTGANGQLGLTIRELFKVNKDHIDSTFVSKSELDITNKEALKKLFSSQAFDFCINCAAYTNVEQAEKTPEIAYQVNSEGVKNIAKICKAHNVTLIHISTDYVFDGGKTTPYTVEDVPNPINEYGKSKLLGEQYIQQYTNQYYIVRISWLYSKTYGNNFYKFIVKSAKEGQDLSITTDQVGCPTNTDDLAHYLVNELIKTKKPYGIYHFSNSKPMTWYDFAQQILVENQLTGTIELKSVDSFKTLARRPKYSVLA